MGNKSAKLLYTLTPEDIDAIAINQIDYKINGVTAILGSQLRLGDVCVAKVTGNRKFYTEETYPNSTSIKHFWFDDDSGDMFNLNYTLSDNNQTATFTVIDNSGSISKYFTFSASVSGIFPFIFLLSLPNKTGISSDISTLIKPFNTLFHIIFTHIHSFHNFRI